MLSPHVRSAPTLTTTAPRRWAPRPCVTSQRPGRRLGTGHAATAFVRALGARVAAGLDVRGVRLPRHGALARGHRHQALSPDDVETIDVAVDVRTRSIRAPT